MGIRNVSHKWNNVISDLGHHREPLFVEDAASWPYYSRDFSLRPNPAIRWWNPYPLERDADLHTMVFREKYYKALSKRRLEFVSCPPISTVGVMLVDQDFWGAPPRALVEAVVRTSTPGRKRYKGVRIGDLLDIYDNMKSGIEVTDRSKLKFCASFWTCDDDFQEERAVQVAFGKSGIEVRRHLLNASLCAGSIGHRLWVARRWASRSLF